MTKAELTSIVMDLFRAYEREHELLIESVEYKRVLHEDGSGDLFLKIKTNGLA